MHIAILIGICAIIVLSGIILLILSLSYDIKSKRTSARLSNHRDALQMIGGLIDRLEEQEKKTNEEIKDLKEEVAKLNKDLRTLSVYIDAELINKE